jgi:hypothetical protein
VAGDKYTNEWEFKVTGAEVTASKFKETSTSLVDLDQKSRIAATRFTGVASASSALGSVLGMVNPKMAGFATVVGTAGGATSGLVTAIGGVGGLAAGGLVAALGIGITYIAKIASETEEWSDKLKTLTVGLGKYIEQIRKLEEQEQLWRRVIAGTSSVLETRASIMKKEGDIAVYTALQVELAEKLKQNVYSSWYAVNQEKEKRQLAEIKRRLAVLKEEKELMIKGLANLRAFESESGKAIGTSKADPKGTAKAKAAQKQVELKYEEWSLVYKLQQIEQDLHNERLVRLDELRQSKGTEQPYLDIKNQAMGLDAEKNFQDERYNTIKASEDKIQAAQSATMSILGSGMTDLMANMIMGEELNLQAILKMVGTQIVKDGLKNAWVAGGLLLNPLTAGFGGPLLAYSAAEVAAGAAMGVIAGSGDTAGPRGAGGPAVGRPTPPRQRPRERENQGPTVIHIHTLNPTVEVGESVISSIKKYSQKRGRHAMPELGIT